MTSRSSRRSRTAEYLIQHEEISKKHTMARLCGEQDGNRIPRWEAPLSIQNRSIQARLAYFSASNESSGGRPDRAARNDSPDDHVRQMAFLRIVRGKSRLLKNS